MIFIGSDDRLCSLLPLSCVLTANGAQCALLNIMRGSAGLRLAPELGGGVGIYNELRSSHTWDDYVLAAIILEALVNTTPAFVDGHGIEALSLIAGDFLRKALHWEPRWRLSSRGSLAHPWLA